MRTAIPARREQSQSTPRHPLFAESGRHAADLWFQFAPLTAAEFRDLRFRNLVAGLGYISNFEACRDAFNDAFATGLAHCLASTSTGEPGAFRRFSSPEQSSSLEVRA